MSDPYITHVAQQFVEAARARGDGAALLWPGGASTSFGDLERRSNRVARLLLNRGVGKRDTVCLSLEKSVTAYAAIIGCLKAGAPYFFVDPDNPAPRTRAMLARCQPSLALIGAQVPLELFSCPVLAVGDEDDAWLDGTDDAPPDLPWRIDGSDPAYVMFTSGSTGEPKGVTISHDNLLHFMRWTRHQLQTRASDIFSGVNPLFFDNSVFDTYASLFAGAALAPVTSSTLKRPHDLVADLDAVGCTIFFSVPSLLVYLQALKLVDRDSFGTFRTIIFGGEGYPKPMLAKLFDSVGGRIELLNVYGPTECTCICSAYRITADDLRDMKGYAALGALIPEFSHVIADQQGRAVVRGEAGELCLAGPGVGLGYYRDPEQTARAFTQNPAHNRFFERMYRTGDLVREDPADGKLYFVGRADTQIKHQGYRIELGEIEHALAAIDAVDEAAAVQVNRHGSSRIVAVVASRAALAPADLRSRVGGVLPAYMVPDRVVVMGALPKNANGKIDRQAIRAALENGDVQ